MIWSENVILTENFRFGPKMRFSRQFEICMLTISIFGDKTPLFGEIIFENYFWKLIFESSGFKSETFVQMIQIDSVF